ncbi:fibrous sheath-interacting protein 2 [Poecile atricapillus]|uniref:fibrous sheath-interacting protein 2 n=1 Tax=Poecile atricapillus TaxID=48891 RepID=UPI0027392B36|nr:fibrous sheath-interacting protein 2 [Poecile atricapillus]
MDPELLNIPLAVKIPVAPGSKPVFCRGKLGEKLHWLFPYFTLDDPYSHHLSPAYNCLHDPALQDYHKRKDVLQLLKKQGFVTTDNKVVCTLKEFSEYREYLTRIKLKSEKILGQQEEGLLPSWAKLKDGPNLPGTTNTSCWGKRRLQLCYRYILYYSLFVNIKINVICIRLENFVVLI